MDESDTEESGSELGDEDRAALELPPLQEAELDQVWGDRRVGPRVTVGGTELVLVTTSLGDPFLYVGSGPVPPRVPLPPGYLHSLATHFPHHSVALVRKGCELSVDAGATWHTFYVPHMHFPVVPIVTSGGSVPQTLTRDLRLAYSGVLRTARGYSSHLMTVLADIETRVATRRDARDVMIASVEADLAKDIQVLSTVIINIPEGQRRVEDGMRARRSMQMRLEQCRHVMLDHKCADGSADFDMLSQVVGVLKEMCDSIQRLN